MSKTAPPFQSIRSAAQLHLPVVIVVLRNEEYGILKSFAVLEQTPGVQVPRTTGVISADSATAREAFSANANSSSRPANNLTAACASSFVGASGIAAIGGGLMRNGRVVGS